MTEPRDPQLVAREALALTMLKDAVVDAIDTRRAEITATWTPGSKQAIVLPNDVNPAKPVKVGEVRCDNGAVTARVADDDAWTAWVAQHHPAEVIEQAPSTTGWALDDESRAAIDAAAEDWHSAQEGRLDGFGGFGSDPARAFLDVLEQAGYTLTPVERVPGRRQVARSFEDAVLKRSKEAETPVTPDGEVPDGIEVGTAVHKSVIVPSKDDALRERYIATIRREMPELIGANPPEEKD